MLGWGENRVWKVLNMNWIDRFHKPPEKKGGKKNLQRVFVVQSGQNGQLECGDQDYGKRARQSDHGHICQRTERGEQWSNRIQPAKTNQRFEWKIYDLMKKDSYSRFIKSDTYRECLKSHRLEKTVPIKFINGSDAGKEKSNGRKSRIFGFNHSKKWLRTSLPLKWFVAQLNSVV